MLKLKMKNLKTFCYLLLAIANLPIGLTSIIEINSDGLMYSKLTVKISDEVPRQLCRSVLDNVEVNPFF